MNGEKVIVRAYGGEPLLRRVWSIGDRVIYIVSEAGIGPGPIGFPREDVFKFNSVLSKKMNKLFKAGKWDWGKLKLFTETC